MHALAMPALLAAGLVVSASVRSTWASGGPGGMHRTRFGRLALRFGLAVYGAMVALWIARAFGAFGGPAPV
jgi:hypothetical protein